MRVARTSRPPGSRRSRRNLFIVMISLMNHARVGWLLFVSLLVMAAVPLFASFYLLEDTLRTSLRLGFNDDVVRVLEQSSTHLRTLGKLDSEHRDDYRAQFDDVERLR